MKLTLNKFFFLLLILTAVASCKTPIDPDFTFSPEMPKAGQLVTFTNLTEEGEHWNWTFGDGGLSLLKNPTYIYRRAGVYDITLRADSNDNYVTTKQIIVYDTIPTVIIDKDSVLYYQNARFSVIAYNPYRFSVTYRWQFSENAVGADIVNSVAETAAPIVFFNKKNHEETVHLTITIGDSVYHVSKNFLVNDVKARSLVMAQPSGTVLRQRIFDNGYEAAENTDIAAGSRPYYIQALDNYLYVFDAGTNAVGSLSDAESANGDGTIRKINLANKESLEIVHNRNVSARHGFYTGYVTNNTIFWADYGEFLYQTPNNNQSLGAFTWNGSSDAQTTAPYYLAKTDRLGYYGVLRNDNMTAGVYEYDQVYFWAKGGDGRGIYRFVAADILSTNVVPPGNTPSAGVILSDFAIRAFDVDHMNQKIYFSVTAPADKVGLWVSSLNGANPVRIDNSPMDTAADYITGIVVDNLSNKVYWAYRAPSGLTESYFSLHPTHRTGVKSLRLVKGPMNTFDASIEYFAPGVAAYGIALDEVKK